MKHKEEFITEEKVINTPAGGVLIGKDKDGQTIIPNDGSLGGFLIGRLHKDGGIKAINKGTGQPLEMQSNEVVITAPAVSDTTKREFEGKMMTNREILSKINSDGGGVSFADGGDIPAKIHTTDCEYKFGGKVVKDTDIAHSLGMNSTLKKGKQQFSSGDTTYDVDAIYNAIKKGKLRLKTKEVETFPMKYPVYDKKYSETVKTDFRKPNGITVLTESGEEVLIDGNHRMNNAYLKGRKTMKTYYIEDPKQISKFSKKNKFELGGENKEFKHSKSFGEITVFTNVEQEYIGDNYSPFENKGSFKATIRKGDLENIALESKDLANFNFQWGVDNWNTISKKLKQNNINKLELYSVGKQVKTFELRPLVNNQQQKGDYEFKNGGHLSKGKSLKQIAEMHNVSLANINEELAKGLEVEKEHFSDFKERTRVAKDHLVENPNYYTILEKAGLKNGGMFNNGGSVSKENEFAFNKKSNRLKSFYKTNNPSIDSLLMECQPFINELVEQQKNLVLKLTLNTNGIETPMSEFAIEQYEIGLIFKMVQSFNKYLKTTDILTDVTIKNVGLFEISANVIRDGKNYSFITELIPAGGYNIQEFHYRYITKTNLPESKENSAIDDLKSKLSVFKKIKSLEEDINGKIISIYNLEKYIKQGYYGDDTVDELYWVNLNKQAILDEQENIERYKKEIEKLKIKQNDLESVLISSDKLKDGGHLIHHRHNDNLVKDAKSGNTPARDLNNYNDIMDLEADGMVGVESGLAFANGGITPYDANIEGDSVDIVESDFAKGGVVYDPKNPKIEKLTITRTGALSGSNRASVIGRYASTVSELQQIVSDYIGTSPQQEYDYIVFRVNDNTRSNYYIELNKGKKNTVKNVNPETLNSLNFKRVIDAKTYLVRNYDWTDFFEGANMKPARKGKSVDSINVIYFDTNGKDKIIQYVGNPLQLYNFLKKLYNDGSRYVELQPFGNSIIEYPISIPITNGVWQDILFKMSEQDAVKKIMENLAFDRFPKLDFSKFNSRYSVNALTTASTSTQSQYPEYYEFIGKEDSSFTRGKIYMIRNPKDIEATGNFYDNYGILNGFSGDNAINFKPSTKEEFLAQGTTSTKTPLTKDELFNSKIWIGDNVELRNKIINKLIKIGIPFDKQNGDPDADKNINVIIFDFDFIVLSDSKEEFNLDRRKEIFIEDLGIDVATLGVAPTTANASTSAKPFDFSMTKIDVSNNPELSVKVQKKAFQDGWEWENGGGKTIDYNTFNYLYFTKTSISYGNSNSSFSNSPKRKITESDIFGSQATASIKKPIVEKLYVENGASFSDIEKIRLYLDTTTVGTDEIYFYINQNGGADYIRVEMKDSLSSMYYNRNAGLEPKYKKLREIFQYNRAFENYDWEEFFSNVVSSSTANVSNLAPYEASQVTLNWENLQGISQTANFYTEDGSGGSGKGFIYFLKEIEKNSNGNDVEVIIRAFAEDNDGKEIERATQFEIGENWFKPSERTNEQIKSIVENDWIDGITFEKFFEDVIPLSGSQTINLPTLSKEDLKNTKIWIGDDVELRDKVIDKLNQLGISIDTSVGNKNYKKNVFIQIYFIDFVVWDGSKTEDFDKNRFKEIFPSDLGIGLPAYQAHTTQYKPIDLSQTKIWIGDDEEVNKQVQKRAIELGWSWKQYASPKSVHFSYETALYFHSDKDISYGNDRQLFDSNKEFREIYFMDLFEKIQPASSTQTPTLRGALGSVQEIEDLKEAVGVLEGIASQVSKKYNTENYEESLKLLNEVKDDYSTALSLTPESAFMYERIEMTKKITEVQKEIKRITELKNGGAFYILSKVIERLEKGENWKELGIGEIMVNEVPEQEIDTVIYTEKFKNWFGDWEKALVTKEYDYVSKALTESGKPCVMYHGAKRIKYSYRQVSNGVLYLAENKSYAEWFSQNNSPYQKQGDYLTQCFVNLKNPIDLTVFGVEEVDLRDIIQYIDALYPLAKIYDVLEPPVLSLEIMNNNLIGLKVRAWNIIRQYPALNTHIRENTNYDGFIYYENNPSDKMFNEQTGQLEDKITKATAVFNSNQVKLVDAMLFDGSLDDWRFETGGKIN